MADKSQTTPTAQLRAAVEGNDFEAASAALKAGAPTRTRVQWGFPVLTKAAGDGQTAIVELLLNAGADTEAEREQCMDNQSGSGESYFSSGPTVT